MPASLPLVRQLPSRSIAFRLVFTSSVFESASRNFDPKRLPSKLSRSSELLYSRLLARSEPSSSSISLRLMTSSRMLWFCSSALKMILILTGGISCPEKVISRLVSFSMIFSTIRWKLPF